MEANMDEQNNGHHLLKHAVPEMERVARCFDGASPKDIARVVARMGQRELQAKFNAVYNTVTRSNNNEWLRRKLLEAVGMKMSIKSKCALKGGARKHVHKVRPSRPQSGNTGDSSSQSSLMRCNTADEQTRTAATSPVPHHESCDSDTSRHSSMSLHRPHSQLWHVNSPYASPNASPTFPAQQRQSDLGSITNRVGTSGYTAVGVAVGGQHQRALLTHRVASPPLPRASSLSDQRSAMYFASQNHMFQMPYPHNPSDAAPPPNNGCYGQSLFLQFAPTTAQHGYSNNVCNTSNQGSNTSNTIQNSWSQQLQPSALLTSHLPQVRQSGGKIGVMHAPIQDVSTAPSNRVMVSSRPSIYDVDTFTLPAAEEHSSDDTGDEDSSADIMHLLNRPEEHRDAAEMAMDEAMDAAIQDLVSEAYSEPFPYAALTNILSALRVSYAPFGPEYHSLRTCRLRRSSDT